MIIKWVVDGRWRFRPYFDNHVRRNVEHEDSFNRLTQYGHVKLENTFFFCFNVREKT